jgi:DNA-binding MarR family transcriptional regulator
VKVALDKNTLMINIIIHKDTKRNVQDGETHMATERLVEDVLALYHLIRRASHPVHREEITPEQYWLLRILWRRGTLSIGELAEALGVTGSSATTACKRLEKAGLVMRERQSDDERMVRVQLTARGRERIEAWHQQRREMLARWLAPLAQDEQEELQRLLERLLESIEQQTGMSALRKEASWASNHP